MLFRSSKMITRGLQLLASFKSNSVKLMIVRRSPGVPRCAAAPFKTISFEPRIPGDSVSFKPGRIGHVAAQDLFERHQTNLIHEILVDSQAAFVLHVSSSDFGPMDFRLKYVYEHSSAPS